MGLKPRIIIKNIFTSLRHREWFEPRNNAISKRNMIIVRASVVLNRTDEDYFAKSEHLHNYNTRSASNIHIVSKNKLWQLLSEIQRSKIMAQST